VIPWVGIRVTVELFGRSRGARAVRASRTRPTLVWLNARRRQAMGKPVLCMSPKEAVVGVGQVGLRGGGAPSRVPDRVGGT